MPGTALITGASTPLADGLAARIRRSGGVAHVATRPYPDGGIRGGGFDEFWYLATDAGPARGRALDADLAELNALLATVRDQEAPLTVVLPALGAAADARHLEMYRRLEREAAGRALVVYLAPLLADDVPAAGLLRVLAEVHGVLGELAARCPGYLARQPLRWPATACAAVPLIDADLAAEALCKLARDPGRTDGVYRIEPPRPTPLAELVHDIAQAGHVDLVPGDPVTDVDRYLAGRLQAVVAELLAPLAGGSADRDGLAAAGVDPRRAAPGPQPRRRALAAAWRSLDLQAETAAKRAACAVDGLDRRFAGPVSYLAGGSDGPTLVLLNALGQGLGFWSRLIDRLADRHRVLTWEPRGTDPGGPALTVAGQVADLRRILDAAGADQAHLVGWCSGPKIALNFCRRYPRSVSSLVFIAGSFKLLGRDPGLDTEYEYNLEQLCRMLEAQPGFASRLTGLLGGDDPQDDEPLAAVDPVLADDVRRPFGNPGTLVRYAAQLLDFWSDDALGAAGIRQPALFIGAELDKITAPARQRAAARSLPGARYAEIIGGTHYCLHDRADLVAALVADFVADPARPAEPYPGVRWAPPDGYPN
jgi:pimeloyl-ACP methyl ester carboxylesterase